MYKVETCTRYPERAYKIKYSIPTKRVVSTGLPKAFEQSTKY